MAKDKPKPKSPARKKPKACILPLKDLQLLTELQMRAGGLNEDHAADMAEAVKKGTKLPRVRVFELTDRDGMMVVTDGFHTCEGTKRAGRATVACEVHQGTWFDAVKDAAAANKQHLGLKRKKDDVRRAIIRLEEERKAANERLSFEQMGEIVGVSRELVRLTVRRSEEDELATFASSPSSDDKRLGADGKLYGPKHQAPKAEPESGPDAWRSIPLTQFIKAADHIWGTLEDAGITKAGQLFDALRKGETFGFAKGDLEALRKEVEGIRSAEKEESASKPQPPSTPVKPPSGKGGNDDPPPTSPPPVPAAVLPVPAKREKDKIGVDIPDSLTKQWDDERGVIKDFRETVKALVETIQDAAKRPYLKSWLSENILAKIKQHANDIDNAVHYLPPHSLCPHVEADGKHRKEIGDAKKCRVCRGANFLPKSVYDQLTPELKQLAENRRKAA